MIDYQIVMRVLQKSDENKRIKNSGKYGEMGVFRAIIAPLVICSSAFFKLSSSFHKTNGVAQSNTVDTKYIREKGAEHSPICRKLSKRIFCENSIRF